MVLSKRIRNQAKRLGIRVTIKRGHRRVYKPEALLRKQINNKLKKKTKRRQRRTPRRRTEFGNWWGDLWNKVRDKPTEKQARLRMEEFNMTDEDRQLNAELERRLRIIRRKNDNLQIRLDNRMQNNFGAKFIKNIFSGSNKQQQKNFNKFLRAQTPPRRRSTPPRRRLQPKLFFPLPGKGQLPGQPKKKTLEEQIEDIGRANERKQESLTTLTQMAKQIELKNKMEEKRLENEILWTGQMLKEKIPGHIMNQIKEEISSKGLPLNRKNILKIRKNYIKPNKFGINLF